MASLSVQDIPSTPSPIPCLCGQRRPSQHPRRPRRRPLSLLPSSLPSLSTLHTSTLLLFFLLTLTTLIPSTTADPIFDRRKAEEDDIYGALLVDETPFTLNPRQTGSGFTMPTAFDGDIGSNFTQATCFPWLQTFLHNIAPCYPISLMLQTSQSYFEATKSLVTITRVLSQSCGVSYQSCSNLLSTYSSQILRDDICLDDYKRGNPIVIEAYTGLIAYEPVYNATCLIANATTGQYCYANAITNASAPDASYPYFLPLGLTIPAGMHFDCNTCLQETMAVFRPYASNTTQPLSDTYSDAAIAIDAMCGPKFVQQAVATSGGASAAIANGQQRRALVILVALAVGSWFLF